MTNSMAEVVAWVAGALALGRLALDSWEHRLKAQAACATAMEAGEVMKPVPPRRKWADGHDYSQYANDPTVRKGRLVDAQLMGIDRDCEVQRRPPTDTIPIEPDLFWRQRRRAHYPITRDEREVVELATDKHHVPYGQQDNSDMFKDEMRARSLARAPRSQDVWWDNVSRPPRQGELWVPDAHLLLPSTDWRRKRRMYGPDDIERSFQTHRQPIDLAGTAQERFTRTGAVKVQRRNNLELVVPPRHSTNGITV